MKKIILPLAVLLLSVTAQSQTDSVTVADYEHAEQLLPYYAQRYVDYGRVSPEWIQGDQFWYRTFTPGGSEFILVNPAKGRRQPAFDQQQLAAALSKAAGSTYSAQQLPFSTFRYGDDMKSISFNAGGKSWTASLPSYTLTDNGMATKSERRDRDEVISPDGKKAAFIRDFNLWVRDLSTGKETQLTTDGVKDFGYATDNAGWKHSDAPVLRWSPDSRKIATFQQDERNVGNMYLVETRVGHPVLQTWKYPLPGDSVVAMIQRVIIDVDAPRVIRLQMPPDFHRGTLQDDISASGTLDDVDWNPDGSELAFLSTSRDHKTEKFRIANAGTGAVREVFEETVPTQYESGQGAINWRYLPKTHEILWYSERDNWGHLYLYDALTGKLKNQIDRGDFVLTQLLKVDENSRMLYFLADGKDPKNPYFTHFCKIKFDGSGLKDLTPETGNHEITLSPSGQYFIDDNSQPDVPNTIVLRNMDGKLVTPLEKTDVSRLAATGWEPPKPFTVKAHDGSTDLYGLMFTPQGLDPAKKYPVIVYIYPGPQGGSVGGWSFYPTRGDDASLTALGFIVVEIEGTSNPLRSKSFHDMSYGFMAENTLPDQVAGIRQLAARFGYLDTTRVGIWGHSGGGFATVSAMFKYPDFFKVGIAESGNHDNREYEDDWGERYIGLETWNANGVSNYEAQANQVYAKNLKGKLMLAHGLLDDNVPPYNTFLVIDALEKANKDYDLVIFPYAHHGYGMMSLYMMRRRWDYFVKNLLGKTPPGQFEIRYAQDPRMAMR